MYLLLVTFGMACFGDKGAIVYSSCHHVHIPLYIRGPVWDLGVVQERGLLLYVLSYGYVATGDS